MYMSFVVVCSGVKLPCAPVTTVTNLSVDLGNAALGTVKAAVYLTEPRVTLISSK